MVSKEKNIDVVNIKVIMGAMSYLIAQIEFCEKKINQSKNSLVTEKETIDDWIRMRNQYVENLKKCISKF